MKLIDLTNREFERLTARRRVSGPDNRTYWLCECKCGTFIQVEGGKLRSGHTRSCGCLLTDILIERNTTHGHGHSSMYNQHMARIDRCYNPNSAAYADYGGRGIKICDRWLGRHGFENFLKDVGLRPSPKHTLDRYPDLNGNYEPDNVRWATMKEQARNRRSNIRITHEGVTRILIEWAELYGISYGTLHTRLKLGWIPPRLFQRVG